MEISSHLPGRKQRLSLVVILSLLTVWFGVLAVRLFQVQILDHDRFLETGRRMRTGTDRVPSLRGDILTADGSLLSRSVMSYEIGVDPAILRSEESLVQGVQIVCDQLGYPGETRRRLLDVALERSDRRYVRLGQGVEREAADSLHEALAARLTPEETKAFRRIPASHRVHPRRNFCSLIGVTDVDGKGMEGLEKSMEDFLTHLPGKRRVVKDATQRLRIYYPENTDVSPINGYDVVLTIDTRTQRILEEELEEGIEKNDAAAGLGVVMDCRSGDILAMASRPSYDPNDYHKYPDEERVRRRKNRVVENTYEPGSILKPFVACWALFTGVSYREELIWGGGDVHRLQVGRSSRQVRDVRDHGPLTLEGVVVHSSNIGMSYLGLRLGRDRLVEMLRRFGFVRKTGINLPGEAVGWRQSTKEWKELYTSVSVAFGYELRITPIQLCTAFAAIVNGGYLYKPRIVHKVVRDGDEIVNPTQLVDQPISEQVSDEMREILHRAVLEGTGRFLQMEGFSFGGKTGTADMDPAGGAGYTKEDYLASFEAFAPYEDPEIVVLVMIEKPRGRSIYGSVVAGPVVAGVLRRYFRVEADITPSLR